MRLRTSGSVLLVGLLLLLSVPGTSGQTGKDSTIPEPPPPPLPRRPPPETARDYADLAPESDLPWGLEGDLLEPLFDKAGVYQAYAKKFTCRETARLAKYDGGGAVEDERVKEYGYLLVQSPTGDAVSEVRQEYAKDGQLRKSEVDDKEPFPPAYAWVYLFSRFNEPYFAYRYLGDKFDGFDWVHEIQFKGSLPFTDGEDIREWEGVALVDAVTFTPLEIRAEPSGQRERIEAMYRRWASSFNIVGARTAPKPLGYSARIEFRMRKEGLTFPTELRYDTFRAVAVGQTIPTKASTRNYTNYRIFKTETDQEMGDQGSY